MVGQEKHWEAGPAGTRAAWLARLLIGLGAALALLHSAASWAGVEDDYREGMRLYQLGDVVGAMNKLRPGAEVGHAPSQVVLAQLFEGAGMVQEAAAQYRKAAEAGNADGQFALGAILADGRGLARDEAAARQWVERAASAGHAGAINYLAQSYMRGSLGLKQPAAADAPGLVWIRRSADSGHLPAIEYLARGYRSGAFGDADPKQAETYQAQADKLRGAGKRPAKK